MSSHAVHTALHLNERQLGSSYIKSLKVFSSVNSRSNDPRMVSDRNELLESQFLSVPSPLHGSYKRSSMSSTLPVFQHSSDLDFWDLTCTPDYRTHLREESMENAYEILRKFNTVILVDDSYSMMHETRRGEARSSDQASYALSNIADIASQLDDDGIDIYFLNS
ncbi:hypothetical protein DFJ43DRAFT_1112837 [Lentinula guzmanii]|uniref:Uncharacterized protein n=1 Tax=Lentinula guzmanii TaxID=2804957 RepID=A0AA38JQ34_9AGAR|nr:hypothetical protein DFJ43DRAFT_1112837 [Lentinula guzmanii]